jgi:hypothetical protein
LHVVPYHRDQAELRDSSASVSLDFLRNVVADVDFGGLVSNPADHVLLGAVLNDVARPLFGTPSAVFQWLQLPELSYSKSALQSLFDACESLPTTLSPCALGVHPEAVAQYEKHVTECVSGSLKELVRGKTLSPPSLRSRAGHDLQATNAAVEPIDLSRFAENSSSGVQHGETLLVCFIPCCLL